MTITMLDRGAEVHLTQLHGRDGKSLKKWSFQVGPCGNLGPAELVEGWRKLNERLQEIFD